MKLRPKDNDQAFKLVFSTFLNHNPQSEIHLNKTTCGLVGGMAASIELHLIS